MDDPFFLVLIAGLWALGALIPPVIAEQRGVAGSRVFWWVAGLFLFPIAFFCALLMRPDPKYLEKTILGSGASKKCPQCAEVVKHEAIKCRFCGHEFSPAAAPKDLVSKVVACPSCRRNVPRAAARCPFCKEPFAGVRALGPD